MRFILTIADVLLSQQGSLFDDVEVETDVTSQQQCLCLFDFTPYIFNQRFIINRDKEKNTFRLQPVNFSGYQPVTMGYCIKHILVLDIL